MKRILFLTVSLKKGSHIQLDEIVSSLVIGDFDILRKVSCKDE